MEGGSGGGMPARHEVHLADRGQLRLTGVQKVESFDHEEIVLVTTAGMLRVQGENLHIQGLDLERGVCGIDGSVSSIVYREGRQDDRRGGLLGRLVR